MHHKAASDDIDILLDRFMAAEKLPLQFKPMAVQWYLPLLRELEQQIKNGSISVLGIAGTQGSGKSTLANFIHHMLPATSSISSVSLSMDDFYQTLSERQELSNSVHPLLLTRGVPGTHDVDLAIDTIKSLLKSEDKVQIPRFDKSIDDRKTKTDWDKVDAPVDLVILEGWCVAAPSQNQVELSKPLNSLEIEEDPNGVWREYVNEQNRTKYSQLYELIDKLILLKAPSFDSVFSWRNQQEEKLRQAAHLQSSTHSSSKIMSEDQIRRFIQHYERLTLQSLKYLPETANVVFSLDDSQQITQRTNN